MADERNQDFENPLIEDPTEGDDELGYPIRYSITSYGSDMPIDGLVDRLKREDIFVPEFQRNFVWTKVQASRFIESLLLGLPVPGIFLFKEQETNKLMVVDGLQRLLTLKSFYEGFFGDRTFKLMGVSDIFNQKTYASLAQEERRFLNDAILHATIFQQVEPSNDRSSVYSIFERLNTGGTPLSPQEIRACVYRGSLNDLLSELADNSHWKHLYGNQSPGKKNEEIILRFFSLYFCLERYDRPMKKFLNEFMEENRDLDNSRIQEFRKVFKETVAAVDTILTPSALRPERALNVSVADAVLVGLAHRLREGSVSGHSALQLAHEKLIAKLRDERLYIENTTSKERVNTRIAHAREAYGAIH